MSNANETVLSKSRIAVYVNELIQDSHSIAPVEDMTGTVRSLIGEVLATQGTIANAAVLGADERMVLVDVKTALPKHGQRIQGISPSCAWIETFDSTEPIGLMTHWRNVPDDAVLNANGAPQPSAQPSDTPVCKGFWDVYEQTNHKRIYVTVFNSAEAASYAENGYKVVEQAPQVAQQSGEATDRDVLLHTFLNAAAGEGFEFDGVCAGDLYQLFFADRNNEECFRIGLKATPPTIYRSKDGGRVAAGHFKFSEVRLCWEEVERYTEGATILYHNDGWPLAVDSGCKK